MSHRNSKLSFGELASDPRGNWEEDGELNFDVNLSNIPDSSQEAAAETLNEDQSQDQVIEVGVNVLHELSGQEVADEECGNFLEDTLVMSNENGVTYDDACEIMDLGYDQLLKMCKFKEFGIMI